MDEISKRAYEFGPFRLEVRRRRLWREGELLAVPSKAIDTLVVLVQHPWEMVRRQDLVTIVWAEAFVEDSNLTVAISQLRKALGKNEGGSDYIETIPRIGYRLVADVREVDEPEPDFVIEKRIFSHTVIEEELLPDHTSVGETITVPRAAAVQSFTKDGRKVAAALAGTVFCFVAFAAFIHFRNSETSPAAPRSATIKSIAVLPPKSLSGDDNGSLSLGLADALITRLGATRKVAVRPTSAILRYVDSNDDPLAVARALGVDAILDGSLQRGNGRTRLTLRLLSAASGLQLWESHFDEADTDIFKLQDSISQQVAQLLSLNLSPDEKAQLTKQQTSNREAYVFYLKGNYFWSRRGAEARHASEYLRRAIDLDPNFSQAYVVLAAVEGAERAPAPEADILIEKALQLDNSSAEAHATYGFLRMFQHWDWDGAASAFDRALELNPNSALAHHWKGVYLSIMGRIDEAKVEMHKALELDPLSEIITSDIGQLHYFAHEYDQCIELCNRALVFDQDFEYAHRYLQDAYLMKGMYREAAEQFITLEESGQNMAKVKAQPNYALVDFENEVRRTLRSYDGPAPYLARRYLYAGDREHTLEWLERGTEVVGAGLVFINVDPLYDSLRSDPRFQNVIKRVGLPAAGKRN